MKEYNYKCDAGSLAILANGAKIMIDNGCGDGSFKLFLPDNDRDIPLMAKFCNVHIAGPCKIEVLDYDCTSVMANVVHRDELKLDEILVFYRMENGNMYLRKFKLSNKEKKGE